MYDAANAALSSRAVARAMNANPDLSMREVISLGTPASYRQGWEYTDRELQGMFDKFFAPPYNARMLVSYVSGNVRGYNSYFVVSSEEWNLVVMRDALSGKIVAKSIPPGAVDLDSAVELVTGRQLF